MERHAAEGCLTNRFTMRGLLFALLLFGIAGLLPELVLQEHYDSIEQWIPIVILALSLASALVLWRFPSRVTLQAFRTVMLLCVAAGVAGLYYHFDGNLAFALERHPDLPRLSLAWKALGGATPTLAPGALVQLGLLGLVYAHGHPASAPNPSSA